MLPIRPSGEGLGLVTLTIFKSLGPSLRRNDEPFCHLRKIGRNFARQQCMFLPLPCKQGEGAVCRGLNQDSSKTTQSIPALTIFA